MAVHSLHAPGMMVEHMIEKNGENPSKNRINCSPQLQTKSFCSVNKPYKQSTCGVRFKSMNLQSSKYETFKASIDIS